MSPIIIAIIVSIVLLASGWLLLNKQNERHAQRLYENEIAKAKEARQEYLDQARRPSSRHSVTGSSSSSRRPVG